MEKVVLSKGYEFELVSNGVAGGSDKAEFKFLPGETSLADMIDIWSDNDLITVQNGETSTSFYRNMTVCNSVELINDYWYDTKYVCPECGAEVAIDATTCPECNATFEAPEAQELRALVCSVKVAVPDINARVSDVEDAVEDIIATIIE